MALSREEVEKVAALARLELNEDEKERFREQLSAVLNYVARLEELELEGVPPTGHAMPLQNVLREDVAKPSLAKQEVFLNAPEVAHDQFLIQAVLDDE